MFIYPTIKLPVKKGSCFFKIYFHIFLKEYCMLHPKWLCSTVWLHNSLEMLKKKMLLEEYMPPSYLKVLREFPFLQHFKRMK